MSSVCIPFWEQNGNQSLLERLLSLKDCMSSSGMCLHPPVKSREVRPVYFQKSIPGIKAPMLLFVPSESTIVAPAWFHRSFTHIHLGSFHSGVASAVRIALRIIWHSSCIWRLGCSALKLLSFKWILMNHMCSCIIQPLAVTAYKAPSPIKNHVDNSQVQRDLLRSLACIATEACRVESTGYVTSRWVCVLSLFETTQSAFPLAGSQIPTFRPRIPEYMPERLPHPKLGLSSWKSSTLCSVIKFYHSRLDWSSSILLTQIQ